MQLLDTRELAKLLGVSRRTIVNLRARGRLPAPVMLTPRLPRWPLEAVERWIRESGSQREAQHANS
jgi:excisionase family DNA binding protein